MNGNGNMRTTLKVVPRTAAVKTGVSRRFQASLGLKGNLAGDELVEQLAQYGFDGQSARESDGARSGAVAGQVKGSRLFK